MAIYSLRMSPTHGQLMGALARYPRQTFCLHRVHRSTRTLAVAQLTRVTTVDTLNSVRFHAARRGGSSVSETQVRGQHHGERCQHGLNIHFLPRAMRRRLRRALHRILSAPGACTPLTLLPNPLRAGRTRTALTPNAKESAPDPRQRTGSTYLLNCRPPGDQRRALYCQRCAG